MGVDVARVRFQPHDDNYRLDVEVLDAEELRARVAKLPHRGFERVDFQCFLFVRSGSYAHTIDFETYACVPGSCLLIGPGQVHRFGPPSDWDGWILIVGPHHIPGLVTSLPTHVQLTPALSGPVSELFERITADALVPTEQRRLLDDLLALQVQILVRRLALGSGELATQSNIDRQALARFREYRALVEHKFRDWRHVADYALELGCSAKSLNRACQAASDVTAKQVIVERILLEAKRLLAHGDDTAARISADLGFNEPTNFTKFFRRETGLTPGAFRAGIRVR